MELEGKLAKNKKLREKVKAKRAQLQSGTAALGAEAQAKLAEVDSDAQLHLLCTPIHALYTPLFTPSVHAFCSHARWTATRSC